MIMLDIIGLTAAAFVALWILVLKLIVPEGQVALLYRNGRLTRRLEPGRYYLPRMGTQYTMIDTRIRVMTITGQEVLSQDNLALKLSVAVNWRVTDPERSVRVVQDAESSLRTAIQLALRRALATQKVEELTEARTVIGAQVLSAVVVEAASFGVDVQSVEIKDLTFPSELKRIFHEVMRAQQEGRAALERARSESAALRNLANAARLLQETPGLMNVRLLQAVGSGGNTLVMEWPDGVSALKDRRSAKPGDTSSPSVPRDDGPG